jgi:type I restriction enzyme S subunit
MASNHWSTRQLGDLTENLDNRRIPVKAPDRRSGPYPYYGASGVVDHVDKYLFDGEYLLVAEDGENLRSRQTPIAFIARGKFWVNNHAHIVRGNQFADTRYLSYVLSQTDVSGYLTGSTMPKLTQGNLNRIPIIAPPLPSQRAIAHALGTLDDLIELNRETNAILEEMARVLFKSWFVDFDPVRAKLEGRPPAGMDAATAALFPNHFQDSELGEIPHGWEVKPLSELCQLGRGASPRPINDFMNGDVPWVKIADATGAGGPFLYETKEKVTRKGAEKSVAVAPGDLILSNSATCGVPMFVELHGCIHDGWLYFKNLHSISKLYLFHALIELAEHLVNIADGSVQKNLNTNLVGQQGIVVPPKSVIDAFDSQVALWFSMMRDNGLESRDLSTLRDTLLPKLLSGELSVSELEMPPVS